MQTVVHVKSLYISAILCSTLNCDWMPKLFPSNMKHCDELYFGIGKKTQVAKKKKKNQLNGSVGTTR